MPDGKALTQTFGAKEPLAAVRLFVSQNRPDDGTPFKLMMNFPKKVFSDDDMDKPLSTLGESFSPNEAKLHCCHRMNMLRHYLTNVTMFVCLGLVPSAVLMVSKS